MLMLLAMMLSLPVASDVKGVELTDCSIEILEGGRRLLKCSARNDTSEHIKVLVLQICNSSRCAEEDIAIDLPPRRSGEGTCAVPVEGEWLKVRAVRVGSVEEGDSDSSG